MIKINMSRTKSFRFKKLCPKNTDMVELDQLLENFRGYNQEDYCERVADLWYPGEGRYNFDKQTVLKRGRKLGLWF